MLFYIWLRIHLNCPYLDCIFVIYSFWKFSPVELRWKRKQQQQQDTSNNNQIDQQSYGLQWLLYILLSMLLLLLFLSVLELNLQIKGSELNVTQCRIIKLLEQHHHRKNHQMKRKKQRQIFSVHMKIHAFETIFIGEKTYWTEWAINIKRLTPHNSNKNQSNI